MELRDVGLLAVVVVVGLGIGWATGGDTVPPSPTAGTPGAADTSASASAPSQFGGASGPVATAMPPPPRRTSEGAQLDASVQARAGAAFEAARGKADAVEAGATSTAAYESSARSGLATSPGGSWGGQAPASGGGWGGQGGSSGGGWGVQAGAAPASPSPAPAQPAPAAAPADQQPAQ